MSATPGAWTRFVDRLVLGFFGNALRVAVALLRTFRRG
jgi:hypothetical protein